MKIRKLFIIFSIFLFIVLFRLYMYEYNILKIKKIKLNNKTINIPIRSDIIFIKDEKVYAINPAFLALYDKVNLDIAIKYLKPKKIIFAIDHNKNMILYSKNSKEYKNKIKYIKVIKDNYKKFNNEIKKIKSIDSCIIYTDNNYIEIIKKDSEIPFIKIPNSIQNYIQKFCK